jgi:hypothetical protein
VENYKTIANRTFMDLGSYESGRIGLLDQVVTYEVKRPFDVYVGPVGPQVDGSTYLPGGGTQITFVDTDVWSNAVPNKYNGYTSNPYLEIAKITPVKSSV